MIRSSSFGPPMNHRQHHPTDDPYRPLHHPHRGFGNTSNASLHSSSGGGTGWTTMETTRCGERGSLNEEARGGIVGEMVDGSGHNPLSSPFCSQHHHHHHPILAAAEPSPFDDLESDPVASSSMDSSEDDRKLAAAAANVPVPDPTDSIAPAPHGHRDGRDRRRHSLSRDPFEGLTARLFPSDESHDMDDANPAVEAVDDDEHRGNESNLKPPAFHPVESSSLHPHTALASPRNNPVGHFYAPEIGTQLFEDPSIDMHHRSLHHLSSSSQGFATAGASPTAFGSARPSLMPPHPFHHQQHQHHPLSPYPFQHHPHGNSSDPLSTPVQAIAPPPQIYRFGHSAPPAYGRHPSFDRSAIAMGTVVGSSDLTSPDPFSVYQHHHQNPPHRQHHHHHHHHHHHQEHQTSEDEDEGNDEEGESDRPSKRSASTMSATKCLPAKRPSHAKRKLQRPASASSSSSRISRMTLAASAKASAMQGGGGFGSGGAGGSTRSGERTSQFRHSPTDEEISEAKTPRARAALLNWYARLADLIEYKAQHGDCNVPQKYDPNPALGIWVNKQRMEKKFMDEDKKTSMTPSKLKALEEAGFTWAKRKGQPSWDRRFSELVQYRSEHGDCNVPTKYAANPALGRWVSTQRSQYKHFLSGYRTQMTSDRMDRLNAIGFRWNMTERELEESRHLPLLSSSSGDEMEV